MVSSEKAHLSDRIGLVVSAAEPGGGEDSAQLCGIRLHFNAERLTLKA